MAFDVNPETGAADSTPENDLQGYAEDGTPRPGAPRRAPSRADVIGSDRWHDQAREAHPDSAFFNNAAIEHRSVKTAVDTVENAYMTRDPRQTGAAHAERVTAQARKAADRIEQRVPQMIQRSSDAIRNHAATIDDRLKISSEGQHAVEIRNRLSSMKPDDRRAAIQQAAQDGDHAVMAAACNAPPFLVGMDEGEQSRALDSYRRRHAPQAVEELDAMKRSAEKLEEAHFEAASHLRRNFIDTGHEPGVSRAQESQRRYEEVLGNL